MRELKFRFWNTLTGEYEEYSDLFFIRGDGVICSNDAVERHLEAEQYTGLKDKNGKEIYEGDIVRWSYKLDRNAEPIHTTDKVEWDTYEEEEWPYSTISGFTLPESEDGYEVIGNIHDNPELLEQGNAKD